ncbi:hypothetical protein BC828DRAFT_398748 [Blastocladiella britannica]|nr:hypothetical protein BC828DRAFT_398748 [Blastocladiella britannica]
MSLPSRIITTEVAGVKVAVPILTPTTVEVWREAISELLRTDNLEFMYPTISSGDYNPPSAEQLRLDLARWWLLAKSDMDLQDTSDHALLNNKRLEFATKAFRTALFSRIRSTLDEPYRKALRLETCPRKLIMRAYTMAMRDQHQKAEDAKTAKSLQDLRKLQLINANLTFNRAGLELFLKECNEAVLGRDEAILVLVLGLVCGENALFLGPAGTGKTMAVTTVYKRILTELPSFSMTLHPNTTDSDLLGPTDIQALAHNSELLRKVDGRMARTNLALVDEVFKATKSALTCLLPTLNKEPYANGCTLIPSELHMVAGISNEVPGGDAFGAMMDRFLLMTYVDYLDAETRKGLELPKSAPSAGHHMLDVTELKRLRALADQHTSISSVRVQAFRNVLVSYINSALEQDALYQAKQRSAASAGATPPGTLRRSDSTRSSNMSIADMIARSAPVASASGGGGGGGSADGGEVYKARLLTDRTYRMLHQLARVSCYVHARTSVEILDFYPVVYIAWRKKQEHDTLVGWVEANIVKELTGGDQPISGLKDRAKAQIKDHMFLQQKAKDRMCKLVDETFA